MSMRVLLFSVAYPGEAGGVQSVIRRLAGYLRRRGHVACITWAVANPDSTAGDSVLHLPTIDDGRPGAVLRTGRSILAAAVRLMLRRPHLVNVHFVSSEARFFLWLRPLLRYKLILSVHGSDLLRPNERDRRHLAVLLGHADGITAVNAPLADHVRALVGDKTPAVRVIPNGVDFDFWRVAGSSPIGDRPMTVVSIGRLLPVKGQDVLIRAMAIVHDSMPEARLLIVGDGPSRAELESLTSQLQLEEVVHFAGPLDAKAVRQRLGEARVFALPSRSEGSPLALLEAMAAGVPVVAAAVGGVPDVLRDGCGILVSPEVPAALADALLALLRDADRAVQLGSLARERARAFAADAADAAYEQMFQEVVTGSRP